MKKIIYIFSLLIVFSCASAKAQNYLTHKVKVGETISNIARKYNVLVSDIYELNPDSKRDLRTDSVLIIPNKKINQTSTKGSSETDIIGYKTHKVKRKETLYSLSKKYKISESEIKKYNTFLYDNNLRKGSKIQIPIFKSTRAVVINSTSQTTPSIQNNDKIKIHEVKPKEGKWRIAYKYGITVPDLERLNPNMNTVLQPGDKINVPNIESSDIKKVDEKYSYYTVLPKEGFYRLKVKLGLTEEQLAKLNPALSKTGLKEGMVLKVPYGTNVGTQTNIENPNSTAVDTTIVGVEREFGAVIDLSRNVIDTSEKHIALMLPFRLNTVNTDSILDTKKQIIDDRYLSTSLDFYTGASIAFETLKKLGVNLKVDVHDTKNMQSQVSSIVRSNDFSSVDAVIGPLMAKNINQVAQDLKPLNIPVVSPLVRKNVKLSENVIQSRPDNQLLIDKIVNFFKKDSTSNFVIISDSKNITKSGLLKRTFKNASIVNSRKGKKSEEDEFYVIKEDLQNVIKPGNNIVFLETQNEGYVSNVVSILNSLLGKRRDEEGEIIEDEEENKIILATTDKNKAFEGEEVSNYHLSNLSFHFPTVAKAFDDTVSNEFVKQYKSVYKETPNKFAVRGYDITMDIVLRLVTSENLYSSIESAPLTEYIENKFAYVKKAYGGYSNDTVYLVKYEDLKTIELKQ